MNAKRSGSSVRHNRLSYSSHEPSLRQYLPDSLRHQPYLRTSFDKNRCPYVRAQLRASGQTEAQRRGDSSQFGSMMVKLNKPFPELRPKRVIGPLWSSFMQAWFREQRIAAMNNRQAEQAHSLKYGLQGQQSVYSSNRNAKFIHQRQNGQSPELRHNFPQRER